MNKRPLESVETDDECVWSQRKRTGRDESVIWPAPGLGHSCLVFTAAAAAVVAVGTSTCFANRFGQLARKIGGQWSVGEPCRHFEIN